MCTPMGKPSSFQYSGNEAAGWPVTLQIGVNGTKLNERMKPARGFSSVASKVPSGVGGCPSVGANHTS